MKKHNFWFYLKLLAVIAILIYMVFFIVDLICVIYYQNYTNNFEVMLVNEYEKTLDTKKVDEKIKKDYSDIKYEKDEQNSFVEYSYTYKVKVVTPPFNFILKDGYVIKDKVMINK